MVKTVPTVMTISLCLPDNSIITSQRKYLDNTLHYYDYYHDNANTIQCMQLYSTGEGDGSQHCCLRTR